MFALVNGEEIPEYFGKPYIKICNNVPNFSEFPKQEKYKKLGSYKRCGEEHIIYSAYDCIKCIYQSERKSRLNKNKGISKYYPDKHDFIKGDGYVFNYCHLIAHQFLEEDLDDRNLVVGTRYMNEIGMSHFEMIVKDYVKNTRNHVLYRVTPVFNENEQLIRGVQMEASSFDNEESGISFNVFIYNVQPGISINYEKCDDNKKDNEWCSRLFTRNNMYTDEEKGTQDYVLNINTYKFHNPNCNCIMPHQIKTENKKIFKWPKKFLEDNGCKPCGNCKP